MDDEKPNRMRTSHKVAISIAGCVLTLQQVKFVKELLLGEQAAAIIRIEASQVEVKTLLAKHAEDETVTHRLMRERDREELAASEMRCEKGHDDLRSRVSNLEVFAFQTHARRGVQN